MPPHEENQPGGSEHAAVARQSDLRTSIRPTVAEIDVAVLRENARHLRKVIGPAVKLFGVVKADAYGHGAVAVARALQPFCDVLAVSLAEEGMELRQAGITAPVLVMGAYYGSEHSDVIEADLTPVVSDPADLEKFADAPCRRRLGARRDFGQVNVHLKLDTGMNRLGVSGSGLADALKILQARPRLRLEGLCTHFACADRPQIDETNEQLRLFAAGWTKVAGAGFLPSVTHAANTAATLRFPQTHFGAVRPGLALYGAVPSASVSNVGLSPALSLRSRVMALHEVPQGAGVSYGHRFVAQRPSRIAVLPLGYADGYPRHLQNAAVLVRGQRALVSGVVCMDMLMIDVTDISGVQVGDTATLIGRDGQEMITLDDIAAWAGTINYEITCGLSKRVPRLYRDGDRLLTESEFPDGFPAPALGGSSA